MSLRAIPNIPVFRPADANETAGAWRTAMMLDTPAVLIFTRQDLPVLENAERIHEGVAHGGYVLGDCEGTPDVILLSSGSEVHIAHEAYKTLINEGVKVRVVSLPCWELFEEQDEAYKESVLPRRVTNRISIEAGVTLGWQKYTGTFGVNIGIDRFGASAPYERIYQEYGLTSERIIEAVRKMLS
jgi:transketolase